MPNKKDETAERVAQLEQQLRDQAKELAEVKAKVDPPKSTFVPMSDEEWRDRMHQAAERRANSWMPPSAIEALVRGEPKGFMAGVLRDSHAPNTPGMIPRTNQQPSDVRGSAGKGWVEPVPLRPPPGVAQADRLMDAQDRRDQIELAQKIAAHEAAMRAAMGKK
jgi:hypothetical protein